MKTNLSFQLQDNLPLLINAISIFLANQRSHGKRFLDMIYVKCSHFAILPINW